MRFCIKPCKPRSRVSGFTLIELLIAVAIVAILAGIGLPSYTSYIARAKRADARTQLVQAAQFMQRFYAANDSYLQDRASPPNPVIGQVPDNLKKSPGDSTDSTKLYDLTIPLGAAPLTSTMSFTLHMVPVAGGSMSNDACGTFTLTSTGLRGVLVGRVAGATTLRDTCWK